MTQWAIATVAMNGQIVRMFPKAYRTYKAANEHFAKVNHTLKPKTGYAYVLFEYDASITNGKQEGSIIRTMIGKNYKDLMKH